MNDRKTVFSNLIWRFAERFGAQSIAFVVSIILARLINPDEYGTVALINVFITISQVFVDSGLGNALIQKKESDELDFSTVFFANIFWCILLYAMLFLLAPFISSFYEIEEMTSYIRVLGLTVLISGIKNVQQAYVSKNMMFKKFFFSTLGGTIIAAVLGISMAYKGFGVWALITQQVVNLLIDTVILWFSVEWRPSFCFSFERLKSLISYGWKLLVSSLIDVIYADIRQILIGKLYSSSDLAYYNQGKKIPSFVITNLNTAIDSVLLPTMAKSQDDFEYLKSITRRSIRTSVFIMAPLMMGMVFCATPIVRLLLTEKWLSIVPFLRIFCITYMFYPIHTANLNAIKAIGRSDLFLKLEIIKKIIGIVLLILTIKLGVMAMAYSLLVSSVFSQIINSWPNKKLIKYDYIEQIKDILPSILLAIFMGVCVSFVSILGLSDMATVILQVVTGGLIYLFGAIIFKIDTYMYIRNIMLQYIKR